MRYHYTPIIMAKLQTTPNAGEKVEQQELSFIAFESANGRVTLEDSLGVSYKTKHTLKIHTIQSRNCALYYSNEGKVYAHTKTRTQMYTAALFTIAKKLGSN